MQIALYQVDAFSNKLFCGNPAAVCPLDYWIADSLMQLIAAENNLSETAFIVSNGLGYEIRWFMPHEEIDLCGHATLAAAHVIFNHLCPSLSQIEFTSPSGRLTATKKNKGLITLDFPSRAPEPIAIPPMAFSAFNHKPLEAYASRDLILCFKNEKEIKTLECKVDALKELPYLCIVATANGEETDFVSRVFDANALPVEDSVTGSAHCSLIPFWADRLNKQNLVAAQLSKRGGILYTKNLGERVHIGGYAKTYLIGKIWTD